MGKNKEEVELQSLAISPTQQLLQNAKKLQADISKDLRARYKALDSNYHPSFFYNTYRYHYIKKPIALNLDAYNEFDLITFPQIAYFLDQFKSFDRMNQKNDPPRWIDGMHGKKSGGKLGVIMKAHNFNLRNVESELQHALNSIGSIINYKIEWYYNVLAMINEMIFAISLSSNFSLFEMKHCPELAYHFRKFESLAKYFTGKNTNLDSIELSAIQNLACSNHISLQENIKLLQTKKKELNDQIELLQKDSAQFNHLKELHPNNTEVNDQRKLLQKKLAELNHEKEFLQENLTDLLTIEGLEKYTDKMDFLQQKLVELNKQKMYIDFSKNIPLPIMKEKDAPAKMKYILGRLILFDFIESLISEEKQFLWRWAVQAQYSKLSPDQSLFKKCESYFNYDGHVPFLKIAELKRALLTLEFDEYDAKAIDEIINPYLDSLSEYRELSRSELWKILVNFDDCEWISCLRSHVNNNLKKPLAIMKNLVDEMEKDPSYVPDNNEQSIYDLYLDLRVNIYQVDYLEVENPTKPGQNCRYGKGNST